MVNLKNINTQLKEEMFSMEDENNRNVVKLNSNQTELDNKLDKRQWYQEELDILIEKQEVLASNYENEIVVINDN